MPNQWEKTDLIQMSVQTADLRFEPGQDAPFLFLSCGLVNIARGSCQLTVSAAEDSQLVDVGLFILVSVNVLAVSLETVDSIHRAYEDIFWWIEIVSVTLFTLEYGLRLWSVAASADERGISSLKARLSYVFSPTGIIDLVAILPSLLPLLFGSIDLRWLRILRLARLFKFSHYTSALEDLISSVQRERQSFIATTYLLFRAVDRLCIVELSSP